jgi:hypothetical protein
MADNDWHDPGWRAAAEKWIVARLDAPAAGAVEMVRAVPWSVTLRVPTTAGVRWFKANTPGCAYEAALAEALGRWQPDAVLVPLAVDAARGWLLSADAGPTLRETPGEATADMLRAYAVLQRELTPRVPEMIALGVPDLRPPVMPRLLAGLGAADLAPEFGDWCAELAADGMPASLQHDDLHDNNVFPVAGGGFRFFDWGDAGVAHPFASLLVGLSSVAHARDLPPGAPQLLRLRDAYLQPWSDLASPAVLHRSVTLACRIGRVSRALAWQRALDDAALPVDEQVRTAVQDWLAELREPDLV